MQTIFDILFDTNFWFLAIAFTSPILFSSLGAHIAKESGLLNIGLEGGMTMGAVFGVIFSYKLLPILGVPLTLIVTFMLVMIIGAIVGWIIGFFHLKFAADIGISGLAVNTLASGLSILLLVMFFGTKGSTYAYQSAQFPLINIPIIEHIPVIGDIISGHNLLVYLAFLLVPTVIFVMKRTTYGLRLRAVGENIDAVESIGINAKRYQLSAMMLSGMLASIGGIVLSMGLNSYFIPGMVAERGFIGLTANTMGNTPFGSMIVSIIFGAAQSLGISIQIKASIPVQFVSMIPYAVVLGSLLLVRYRVTKKKSKLGEV